MKYNSITSIDLETTGIDPSLNSIIEIAVVDISYEALHYLDEIANLLQPKSHLCHSILYSELSNFGINVVINGMVYQQNPEELILQHPIAFSVNKIVATDFQSALPFNTYKDLLLNKLASLKVPRLVAHNAYFEWKFLYNAVDEVSQEVLASIDWKDTLSLARSTIPNFPKYSLDYLIKRLKLLKTTESGEYPDLHRALPDAVYTGLLFHKLNELVSKAKT